MPWWYPSGARSHFECHYPLMGGCGGREVHPYAGDLSSSSGGCIGELTVYSSESHLWRSTSLHLSEQKGKYEGGLWPRRS